MERRFDTHFNVIGVLHLSLGLICLTTGLTGLFLLAFGGALATWVATAANTSGLVVAGLTGSLMALLLSLTSVFSLPQIAAGIGLLQRRPWAPAVALFVSLFHLFSAPFGTALAAYTGWCLLSEQGQRDYKLIRS